jgi:hypothetical protein
MISCGSLSIQLLTLLFASATVADSGYSEEDYDDECHHYYDLHYEHEKTTTTTTKTTTTTTTTTTTQALTPGMGLTNSSHTFWHMFLLPVPTRH